MSIDDEIYAVDPFVDPEPAPPAEPTEEDEYSKAFNEAIGESVPEELGETALAPEDKPGQRIYETMSDDELDAIFRKAREVDDLKERVRKTHDTFGGRIGSLEAALRNLSENRPTPAPVKRENFKHLEEYLGEDSEMLDALANDLASLQLGIPLTPNFDLDVKLAEAEKRFAEQNEQFAAAIETIKSDFELKVLNVAHPDWEELKQTDDFVDWQKTLTDEARTKLTTTWSGVELAQFFTKFKDWRKRKDEYQDAQKRRLEGNIPVRSNGFARPYIATNENDYSRGFKEGAGLI